MNTGILDQVQNIIDLIKNNDLTDELIIVILNLLENSLQNLENGQEETHANVINTLYPIFRQNSVFLCKYYKHSLTIMSLYRKTHPKEF